MKLMVAFSSPKRSAKTLLVAAKHARALNAEVVLVRVVPDAVKVGVVAQLIESDRPAEKAQNQIDKAVEDLKAQGIAASGQVYKGAVAQGLVKAAHELSVDIIFLGTASLQHKPFFLLGRDPIVQFLVDRCPQTLVLVRNDETLSSSDEGEADD